MPDQQEGESDIDYRARLNRWARVDLRSTLPQAIWHSANFIGTTGFAEHLDSPVKSIPAEPFVPNDHYTADATMLNATKKLLREQQPVGITSSGGDKEREYQRRDREKKQERLTGEELLDSDTPIFLRYLTDRQYAGLRFARSPDLILTDTQFGWRCAKCGSRPAADTTFLLGKRFYCSLHVPKMDMCGKCNSLQENCSTITQFDEREAVVCATCKKNKTSCQLCGDRIPLNHIEIGMCDTCLNAPRGAPHQRTFFRGMTWVGKEEGEIVKSNRIFSCEIETGTPSTVALVSVAKEIPSEAGMGHDGSIKLPNPFEIQSPKLAGSKGEEFVTIVTTTLHKYKAVVNESCGLHVHLDGKGIISPSRRTFPVALLQLWKAHLIFEDVILSLVPYSRRRNDYCLPMGNAFKLIELSNIGSLLDAERVWYREGRFSHIVREKNVHRHDSRYFGVNMHSLLSDGHLEIRYHSGTVNPKKILEWANLHCLIMDAAAAERFTHEFLREAQATSSLKEKTEMLFNCIGLAKSSQTYFRERQQKFMDKKQAESNLKE